MTRPTPCPICGLVADNAVVVHGEIVAMATYVCTDGHIWSLTWAEVS